MSDMQYSDKSKLTAKPDQVEQGPENAPSISPMRIQRMGAMDLQRLVGNQATQRLLRKTGEVLQTKMTVGAADDAYEQEADRVAAQVVSDSQPAVQRSEEGEDAIQTMRIQRNEGGEEEGEDAIQTMRIQRNEGGEEDGEDPIQTMRIQRESAPEEEEPIQAMRIQRESAPEEEEPIQTMRIQRSGDMSGSFDAGEDVEKGIESSRGNGQALPDSTRGVMESKMGYDFSGITLHSDSQSHALNRSVGAQAFAVGSDVYLGESAPSLDSKEGQKLMAHELTHTVQQGAAAPLQAKREDD